MRSLHVLLFSFHSLFTINPLTPFDTMPNHITNYLTIHTEDPSLETILDAIAYPKPDDWAHASSQSEPGSDALTWGRYTIDFNSIVPMPADTCRDNLTADKKEALDGRDWYTWSCDNWGTKWNAYWCTKNAENQLLFHTAWSNVEGLIEKLSQKFPNAEFEYSYYDEDFGAQVARTKWRNGELLEKYRPDNFSKEAYELIFEMTGDSAEDRCMRFDEANGTYVYDDDDE